jgi:hypothetical protein
MIELLRLTEPASMQEPFLLPTMGILVGQDDVNYRTDPP